MSWTCPNCERDLLKENQWHNCVKVSIDSLFESGSPELMLISDKILAEVSSWDNVVISTSKNCIVFMHRRAFLVIRPMKNILDVKFYSKVLEQGTMIFKCTLYAGKYENHIRIGSLTDLKPQLFIYLHNSYQLL